MLALCNSFSAFSPPCHITFNNPFRAPVPSLDSASFSFASLTVTQAVERIMLSAEDLATVLLEIYSDLPYPQCHVEIMVSWMLKAFDRCALSFVA